jgi:Ser/Thr protein kinase RdoA (MazF antagonist)
MSTPEEAAQAFPLAGPVESASPLSGGNIHDTYLVHAGGKKYVLQRMSAALPVDAARLMKNIARVSRHLAGKESNPRRRLALLLTRDDQPLHRDSGDRVWRAFDYVGNTVSHETAHNPEQAYEAARAFGRFLALVEDIPLDDFDRVLPHFHDTPKRFLQFERALAADVEGRAAGATKEIEFLSARRQQMGLLTGLCESGEMTERIIHNDTKISNVLFDEVSGEGLCVVDLDTVMPGLVLYDFGDLVRSAVTGVREDETDLAKVTLRGDIFAALTRGFVKEAGALLSPLERGHLVDSVQIIAMELGMRFLTDHLGGDVYFKTTSVGQNLARARVQLKIAELFEQQRGQLVAQVASLTAL